MSLDISLATVADFSDDERTELQQLGDAVYPPEVRAGMPGMKREWSYATWGIRGRLDGQLVAYVGTITRNVTLDGRSLTIGGIGGVKTHPDFRRKGYAGQCLDAANEFFDDQGVEFALLVCLPHLIEYYGKFGYNPFNGTMHVTQFGEPEVFSFNQPLVRSVRIEAPTDGELNLHGAPW